MGFHKDVTLLDIHTLHFQDFADAATRLAFTYAATDVGKMVRQSDNNTWYIVTDDTVPSFIQLGQAGGSPVDVRDEGVQLTSDVQRMDFVGAGVTVTEPVPDQVQVSIPGLDTEDEGVSVEASTAVMNFVGAGVTVTNPAANQVDVTIPGGGGGAITTEDEGIVVDAATTLYNFIGAGVTAASAGAGLIDVTIPGGGAASFDDILVDAFGDVVTSGGNVVSI